MKSVIFAILAGCVLLTTSCGDEDNNDRFINVCVDQEILFMLGNGGILFNQQAVDEAKAALVYRQADSIVTVHHFYLVEKLSSEKVSIQAFTTNDNDATGGQKVFATSDNGVWSIEGFSETSLMEFESKIGFKGGLLILPNMDGSVDFMYMPTYIDVGQSQVVQFSFWHPDSLHQYEFFPCDNGWYRQRWVDNGKTPQRSGDGWSIDGEKVFWLTKLEDGSFRLYNSDSSAGNPDPDSYWFDFIEYEDLVFDRETGTLTAYQNAERSSWTTYYYHGKMTPEEYVESIQ